MNQLIKLITYEGDQVDPLWHAVAYSDTARTLCGYALDAAAVFTFEQKEVKRGGLTCDQCIDQIKQLKAIKL